VIDRLREIADRHIAAIALGPAVVLLIFVTVYPALNLVAMSVSTIEWVGAKDVWSFTPARNFGKLLDDRIFRVALLNTVILVVLSVGLEMVLGLAMALLVSGVPRMKGVVRTAMIVPILMPPVAIGSMWKLMYNYDFGIFNQTLATLGVEPVNWLGDTRIALLSIVLVDVWHWVPLVFLILFAAIEALPRELIEAARIDGAGTWRLVRSVIVPLIMPAITVALVFRSIGAFKMFDQIFLLTSGGPGTSTEVVSLHLYKVFFRQNELGYGALVSITVILAILAFLWVTNRLRAAAARYA
jgi:multiple sugar transport system permease protein